MSSKRTAYHAYLLRLWRETAGSPWRVLLESVATDKQRSFTSLESLFSYLDHVAYQHMDKEIRMTEHPNAALIKKGLEAFNQGNPGVLMALIADDAVFYIPGNSPIAGEYRGKEAIGGFFQHLGQLSEGPLQIDLQYVLNGGDEHVVAVWTARGTRKGINYKGVAGYIFQVRDRKIVQARNLQEDQNEIDAFWSA